MISVAVARDQAALPAKYQRETARCPYQQPVRLLAKNHATPLGLDTHVDESGLTDRAIYNSINMAADKSELDALAATDVSASIILGFNPMNATVDGKMAMWEDGDNGAYEKGLLEVAEDCGIDKFMMDTAVTPLGQGAGIAAKTSFAEKAKWGYPVGSGIHNVPSAWDWLREYKKAGHKDAFTVCDIGANIVQVMCGGDFVLFGPIENARIAFPAVAQTDMFICEAAADFGTTVQIGRASCRERV